MPYYSLGVLCRNIELGDTALKDSVTQYNVPNPFSGMRLFVSVQ